MADTKTSPLTDADRADPHVMNRLRLSAEIAKLEGQMQKLIDERDKETAQIDAPRGRGGGVLDRVAESEGVPLNTIKKHRVRGARLLREAPARGPQ